MTTPLRISGLLLLVAFFGTLPAQPPPRRGHHRGERERLDHLRRGVPPHELDRRRRVWDEVVETLSPTERRRFRALSFKEKEAFVRDHLRKREEAEREAFVASLSDEERDSLDRLQGAARERRLQELRLRRQLDRVLAEARERGIIDQEEAEKILAAPIVTQAREMVGLQKKIFLVVNAEEFASADPALQRELKAMPPERFFQHPWTRGFRHRGPLTGKGLATLRESGPGKIRAFLERVEAGQPTAEDAAMLSGRAREDARSDDALRRRRLVRHLRRTVFRRDLRPLDRPGPHRGPRGRQVMPPPHLMDELSRVEREEFFHMPNPGRRRFLARRFPEWWASLESGTAPRIPGWFAGEERGGARPPRRHRGPRGPAPTLGELLEWYEALPASEKKAARDLPLRRIVEEHLRPGGPGPGRGRRRGPPRDR